MYPKGKIAICVILIVISIGLVACAASPLFPPEIIRDIENDSVAFKEWKDQTSYSSSHFVSRKVEVEGEISKVVLKQDGIVILVDGSLLDERSLSGSIGRKGKDSFRFAIVFNGMIDPAVLQSGNRLVAIGSTDKPSREAIGWMSRMLPHLLAQCLYIWKINENEFNRHPGGDVPRRYAQAERTFCHEEKGKPPTDDQDDKKGIIDSLQAPTHRNALD